MKRFVLITGGALAALLTSSRAFAQCPMTSPPGVLTAQYDQNRSDTNTNETCLSAATWASQGSSYNPSIKVKFGTIPSGGTKNSPVYAQPLYVSSLDVGPGCRARRRVAPRGDHCYAR